MTSTPAIAAIVLAAGRGARFSGAQNKLLAELGGRPLLRRSVEAALASRVTRTIVVTGHSRAKAEAALTDLPVVLAHNPDFASGMASSLRAGLSLAAEEAGVLVLLADMPGVSPDTLDQLIMVFGNAPSPCVAVVPVYSGRRGNPVLLGRKLFPRLAELKGDEGARQLLQSSDGVLEAPVEDKGVVADVDTAADLEILREYFL
jgi:molybdenum cofactor cytidylyltransferase